jgi:hypothetical protein
MGDKLDIAYLNALVWLQKAQAVVNTWKIVCMKMSLSQSVGSRSLAMKTYNERFLEHPYPTCD